MPEFSNSANTPTFLPKISTTNKKGKEEKSCAKKEETEDDKIISVPEIENTPTPENCNHGLFLLLRKFATNRKEKKAARYKFTKQAWKEMIKHFLEFSKRYSINVLELHLNESLNSVWISPFDSWAYDKLDRLQKSIGGEKPNSVQNIATKQQTGLFSEVCKKAYPNITTDTMSKIWVEIKAMMPKATDSELCEYAQKLFVQWGTAAMTPIKALSYPSRYFKINML